MAVKTKTVVICDLCGFMVEAIGDGSIGCAEAPDNWGHGKSGNVDICPKCAKKLEKPEWNYRATRDSLQTLERSKAIGIFCLLWVLEWNGVIKPSYSRVNHLL